MAMYEEELSEFNDYEDDFEDESPGSEDLDDEDAEELAAELLQVGDEEELEEFFGSLLKSAARAARGFLRSSVGRKLVGAAKSLAKRHLPSLAARLGGRFGGDVGRRLGGRLGRFAASRLEAESELELEVAKRVVLATIAAGKAAARTGSGGSPTAVAQTAMRSGVRKFNPGSASKWGGRGARGQWVRRGSRIVLLGAG